MFNNEKDHHFIVKKFLYYSCEIWFVKFNLNLIDNLLFIGDMEKAAFNMERPDFYVHRGSHVHFTTSYYRLYERYFQKLLGYPIWILPREDAVAIEQNPETADMPPFPGDGCIKEVDGVFVVKMSDVKLEVYGQSE